MNSDDSWVGGAGCKDLSGGERLWGLGVAGFGLAVF